MRGFVSCCLCCNWFSWSEVRFYRRSDRRYFVHLYRRAPKEDLVTCVSILVERLERPFDGVIQPVCNSAEEPHRLVVDAQTMVSSSAIANPNDSSWSVCQSIQVSPPKQAWSSSEYVDQSSSITSPLTMISTFATKALRPRRTFAMATPEADVPASWGRIRLPRFDVPIL